MVAVNGIWWSYAFFLSFPGCFFVLKLSSFYEFSLIFTSLLPIVPLHKCFMEANWKNVLLTHTCDIYRASAAIQTGITYGKWRDREREYAIQSTQIVVGEKSGGKCKEVVVVIVHIHCLTLHLSLALYENARFWFAVSFSLILS